MKTLAVFPGSFDPFTLGHLDVLKRACRLFGEVRVCVLENADKRAVFTADERVQMIRHVIGDEGLVNACADSSAGLTAQYAKSIGATHLVRGLRNAADYAYETEMEAFNRLLAPEVQTVYLTCGAKYAHVSSGAVRELARYGADIGTLVPDRINKIVSERLIKR
ncbi:MAG TPA: pantetheine-phosphate adenylyltransferase [Clostridia bacterium]|nr:pantetheine-phosphate adenylyltransferase [Clostridia bacterium]